MQGVADGAERTQEPGTGQGRGVEGFGHRPREREEGRGGEGRARRHPGRGGHRQAYARGPVGVEGLTTTKYYLEGEGHRVAAFSGADATAFTHRTTPDATW